MQNNLLEKTITMEQYYQLKNLRDSVVMLQNCLEKYYKHAVKITKESNDNSYTFDYLYNGFPTIDKLLDKLNIKISE